MTSRRGAVSKPRLLAALAVATLVTVVALKTGNWWTHEWPGSSRNLTVARILLFAGVACATYWAPPLLARTTRVARWTFLFWVIYLGFWLVGTWPGISMTDTVDLIHNVRQGALYEWFSYLTPLTYMTIFEAVPRMAVLGLIQVGATALLMGYASSTLFELRPNRAATVAMNVVAALSVPIVVNSLLYSRDTIFSLLHVFLALYVARIVVGRRTLSMGPLTLIAVLTACLTVLRGDGIALALAVPLVLLLTRPNRRLVLRGAAVFAAALLALHVGLPALLSIREQSRDYGLALRLNPLGRVLQSDFHSDSKEADLRALGRMVDVEAVKRLSTPVEIPVYWEGRWNMQASDEDFAAFTDVTDRLLRDNAATVLAGRVDTFGAASGLSSGGFTGTDLSRPQPTSWIGATGPGQDIYDGAPPFDGLYDFQADLLEGSAEFHGFAPFGSALHWNFLPWLVLLCGPLVLFRRLQFEAAFAFLILCRVPLVFLLAPASQFKYYYSVYLGGIVMLGLLLSRVRITHLRKLGTLARPVRPAAR